MLKEKYVTITEDGQDFEFCIKQMPASQLEWWIIRAVQLIGGSLDVDATQGLAGVGKALSEQGLSALAKIDLEKAKPLLDEMLGTASRVLSGSKHKCTPETIDATFASVKSLFTLRMECFKHNLDFFVAENPSESPPERSERKGSPIIKMSQH